MRSKVKTFFKDSLILLSVLSLLIAGLLILSGCGRAPNPVCNFKIADRVSVAYLKGSENRYMIVATRYACAYDLKHIGPVTVDYPSDIYLIHGKLLRKR